MFNPVLHNYADSTEGVVKTRGWGTCESTACPHADHDPHFRYFVTEVNGQSIWQGESGERIVVSNETGRAWYTRYHANGRYAPSMITVELTVENGKPVLPGDIVAALRARYVSPRHECLIRLAGLVHMQDNSVDVDQIASIRREYMKP